MLTKMMKLISIAVLLLTAMLWSYAPSFGLAARFVVALSALLVAAQAVPVRKYYWAVGFCAIAVLFNPFVAVFTLSGYVSLLLVLATVAPFGISLTTLKTQPVLSIPSITDGAPGSESL